MHPCPENSEAIGRAVVFYARAAHNSLQKLNVFTVCVFGNTYKENHVCMCLRETITFIKGRDRPTNLIYRPQPKLKNETLGYQRVVLDSCYFGMSYERFILFSNKSNLVLDYGQYIPLQLGIRHLRAKLQFRLRRVNKGGIKVKSESCSMKIEVSQ